ncbi:hypothetical protein TG4357_01967 [Thalassovita gelatinovora]|uniref:Uncharacterized protein n=1 Tax=Thalassovita gelatinovora TaxID=53501 RepID=A0A0P1FBP6_THAGE|nr:hypothetical protein [Thalassovita gelatinovora]QIZ79979.1 hypothetical protein HFZ77_05510 [Thalassovita gelatinovora]CUH65630.1 hypothetical protein TG4357_01967 [Thalassovita gelatinovora]SER05943.1 hypothetical protein SAMN04488043_11487 [Thalassovita gelatinovora]
MIHVMNPYQMSTAFFRLASLSLECQMEMMQALSKMSMAAIPASKTQTGAETATTVESAPKRKVATKPATARSHGAAKPQAAKSRQTRKPSAPPVMPETSAKTTSDGEDSQDNMPV